MNFFLPKFGRGYYF
uniref:Uncharacterized protein n=1 Tax=Rhizophora mucronata TaxID=61149 RepID=A0A2P2QDH4_RHIMU